MSDRLPWFPFETVAWRGDLNLRSCSAEARAVWFEMLTVMHEAEPRGYFLLHGQPLDRHLSDFSKIAALKVKVIERGIEELGAKLVFSRTVDGVIFNRKMVRDEKRRATDRSRQRKKRDKDRDTGRDVTPSVTASVTRDVTEHVTDTGVRGIARQSFRDQKDQNHKDHRAENGAGRARPVEKSEDGYRPLSIADRRELAKHAFTELSQAQQHRLLCQMVADEMDAGHVSGDTGDTVEDTEHLKDVAVRAKFPDVTSTELRKAMDAVVKSRTRLAALTPVCRHEPECRDWESCKQRQLKAGAA